MSANQQHGMNPVTSETLQNALLVHVAMQRPAFIWGSPGIGKSAIVAQVAKRLGRNLIDIRASQMDAVDTRGVPFVDTDDNGERRTSWAIPDMFPTDPDATDVVFLDELNTAPLSVQAACYQLVLDRRLGHYTVPEGVSIIAAGNLETDRAVAHRMSSALADRFFHYLLTPEPNVWMEWALDNDIHLSVLTFLKMRPDLLHDWDPKMASKAQPTPRGWEFVSDALHTVEKLGINGDTERAVLEGKLGYAVASEFIGYLGIARNLPDPDAVLLSPHNAPLPDSPSIAYAMCGALASRATEDNFDRVTTYADRLADSNGPEYATLLVLLSVRRNPDTQNTRAFVQWASDHAGEIA